ncbi:MAG: TMEM165/GDT1 family protein [Sandarakinorhabdus sp.]|nr:TMEM165/GDT1 family protein [Sandarakinorhabdus sp.]
MSDFTTAMLTSAGVVALAEIGDKTQLLAIVLATRFRAPWAVIAGIFVATLANHAVAAWAGSALAGWFDGPMFRYFVAASFIAMAIWTLVPDKLEQVEDKPARYGAFLTTAVAFFIVEIGDKTQVATVALGARFDSIFAVTLGTTTGIMLANVPAIFLGHKLTDRVPMRTVHVVAALVFLVLGLWLLAATYFG